MGPGFLLLAVWDRGIPSWLRPLVVSRRVPFFYYCLHLPLIHGLAQIYYHARFGRGDFNVDNPANSPAEAGFGLPVVYLVWAVVILLLYPVCRWFADCKRRHRDVTWLSYL